MPNVKLELMANQVLRSILLNVKQQYVPYFSIIVDETTDVLTKEQVIICLRSVSEDLCPSEDFVGLYDTSSWLYNRFHFD